MSRASSYVRHTATTTRRRDGDDGSPASQHVDGTGHQRGRATHTMIRLLLRNRGVEQSDKTFMKAVDKSIMTTPTGQSRRRGRMWAHKELNYLRGGAQCFKRRCQHHKPSLDMDVNETGRHAVWSRDHCRPEQPATVASCFIAGNTYTHIV